MFLRFGVASGYVVAKMKAPAFLKLFKCSNISTKQKRTAYCYRFPILLQRKRVAFRFDVGKAIRRTP